MLSRRNRFHGLGSLNHVYKHGQTSRGDIFSVKFIKNQKNDYRLAVVVSKKVHKSAVKRNQIRRRIYEAVRQLKINDSFDIVITIYSEKLLNLKPDELKKMLKSGLEHAGIATVGES